MPDVPTRADLAVQLVDRFFHQVFNAQDADTAREILAADFLAHHPAYPAGIRRVEGLLAMISVFRGGFPDLHYRIQDSVSADDKIAVRWRATGQHTGVFLGVPATGRAVAVTGIDIFRHAEDLLVEAWVSSDLFGLFTQLGAFPSTTA